MGGTLKWVKELGKVLKAKMRTFPLGEQRLGLLALEHCLGEQERATGHLPTVLRRFEPFSFRSIALLSSEKQECSHFRGKNEFV